MSSNLRNAKQEFLDITKNYKVIAANIKFDTEDFRNELKLKPLYTKEEFEKFLIFLDQNYDSGYGGQELYGTIFCENGVWMQRGEYDGSEWWNTFRYPNMRDTFDEVDVLKYERNRKLKQINNI